VARLLRLAEQLGGEAAAVPGTRVADEILRYARERNASEIVLGKPRGSKCGDEAPEGGSQ